MAIEQDEVERALTYLAESAQAYAAARGLRVWLEESARSVKAVQMLESTKTSVSEREAQAYASDAYKDHLRKLRDAVTNEELLRAYRAAASTKVEVWRSQESSRRAANIV